MSEPRRVPPERWLELATFRIAFIPDRKAVRAELEEHLEDKALDLQRIFPDLTEKEARERAAADMGDPVEIGTELAQLHRPWLGYLWRASQAVLAGALLASVFTFGGQILDGALDDWRDQWEYNRVEAAYLEMIFEDREPVWTGERRLLYPLDPDASQRQGNGTFTVSRAALWQEREDTVLYLDVRIDFNAPWLVQEVVWQRLEFSDSLGNHYGPALWGLPQRGLGWLRYSFKLYDFDPAAEWVRLTYLPGTELSLTIDLTQGVEA